MYGADSARLFILSDSPPEKDVQWSEQGMLSAFKFVQKFWVLHKKIKSNIERKHLNGEDIVLKKFTNQLIYKILTHKLCWLECEVFIKKLMIY